MRGAAVEQEEGRRVVCVLTGKDDERPRERRSSEPVVATAGRGEYFSKNYTDGIYSSRKVLRTKQTLFRRHARLLLPVVLLHEIK